MTNPYVLAGYLAAAAILLLYCVHLRHRGRALARALGESEGRPVTSATSPAGSVGPAGPAGPADSVESPR